MSRVENVNVRFEKLGGITLKLLMVDNEIDLLSSGYLLQRYDSGCKINTVKRDSLTIGYFYKFCIDQGFDFHCFISSHTPMPIGAIEQLSSHCAINIGTAGRVSSEYYSARMRVTWRFISWLWSFYQNQGRQTLEELKASKLHFESMEKGFRLYLSAPYSNSKLDRVGLSPELRSLFLAIINPLPEDLVRP